CRRRCYRRRYLSSIATEQSIEKASSFAGARCTAAVHTASLRLDHVASHIVKATLSIVKDCQHGQHLVAPRNEIGNVVKGKLLMLFRRFVLFARNSGVSLAKLVKEKLVIVFRSFVLFARNVGSNRENDEKDERRPASPLFAWPHVMNSSVA